MSAIRPKVDIRLLTTEPTPMFIAAAERNVDATLSVYQGKPLVVVVSEKTLDGFQQVQLKVAGNATGENNI